jgi:hypothetical protein
VMLCSSSSRSSDPFILLLASSMTSVVAFLVPGARQTNPNQQNV